MARLGFSKCNKNKQFGYGDFTVTTYQDLAFKCSAFNLCVNLDNSFCHLFFWWPNNLIEPIRLEHCLNQNQ